MVAVDCAKARSKWLFWDFYGRVPVPPTPVEHTRKGLRAATACLQEACRQHDSRDHIVAIEMTGVYHRPVQRVFRKAGSETQLVHPFASRHFSSRMYNADWSINRIETIYAQVITLAARSCRKRARV